MPPSIIKNPSTGGAGRYTVMSRPLIHLLAEAPGLPGPPKRNIIWIAWTIPFTAVARQLWCMGLSATIGSHHLYLWRVRGSVEDLPPQITLNKSYNLLLHLPSRENSSLPEHSISSTDSFQQRLILLHFLSRLRLCGRFCPTSWDEESSHKTQTRPWHSPPQATFLLSRPQPH